MEEVKDLGVCGVVKARVTSTKPTDVGSSPTSGASCCSSEVEQRRKTRAADSRRKEIGAVTPGARMAQYRDTSLHKKRG